MSRVPFIFPAGVYKKIREVLETNLVLSGISPDIAEPLLRTTGKDQCRVERIDKLMERAELAMGSSGNKEIKRGGAEDVD